MLEHPLFLLPPPPPTKPLNTPLLPLSLTRNGIIIIIICIINNFITITFNNCRLHEFVWHGCHRSEPGIFHPRLNIFNLLRCIPSQIYVNVRDVRTNDDTLITVKLMVFFELKDIDRMVSCGFCLTSIRCARTEYSFTILL